MNHSPAFASRLDSSVDCENALAFRKGRLVQLRCGANLRSDLCFKCAKAAKRQKSFVLNWEPSTAIIGLVSPIGVVSKMESAVVTVGFCDRHWRGLIGWNLFAVFGFVALLVGGLGLMIAGHIAGLLVMFLSGFAPLLAFVFGRQVTVSSIKNGVVVICGAGRRYLNTLPSVPQVKKL